MSRPRLYIERPEGHQLGDANFPYSCREKESLRLDGNRQSIVIVLIKRREGLNVAFRAVGVQYTCVSLTHLLHSSYRTYE